MKYFFITLSILILSSCGAARTMQTEKEIEEALKNGDITKKEYLQMRIELEKASSSSGK